MSTVQQLDMGFAPARPRRNWVAVACLEHALRGCAEPERGFMQVCHGKRSPLQRMAPGDRVVYYAPTRTMGGKDKVQAFVSAGLVLPGVPYAYRDAGPPQVAMAPLGGSAAPTEAAHAASAAASVGATSFMGGGFVSYRRDVAYVPAQQAPIVPLLDALDFVEDRQRWGYPFRFGLFAIGDADMRRIAAAMQAAPDLLHFS